jgi:hypothetical protein
MIAFAEAKSEEMGDEARTPRGATADGEGRSGASPKPDPKAAAHKLLGGRATPVAGEARPTFEQLFPDQTESAPVSEEAPVGDEEQTTTAVADEPVSVESNEETQTEATQEVTQETAPEATEPSSEEEQKTADGPA